MLSILATATAPESNQEITVGLSSPTDSFGIRAAGSQLILAPSGTEMTEISDENWQFSTDDPLPGEIYEFWLKFEHKNDTFFVNSFICSCASLDPVVSESESEDGSRKITLTREQTTDESFGHFRGDSVRLRVTVSEAQNMDANIFGFMDRGPGADFSFVASPFDSDIYPADAADTEQIPSFYLKNQIDILCPTIAAANAVWAQILVEVDTLIAALNRHDTLSESSDDRIE